jgi:hypothetical protein
MSLVEPPPEIADSLRRSGLLPANERATAQALTGGVSSAIWRVDLPIEEPELIERILAPRREWGEEGTPMASLGPRAPPPPWLF